MVNKSEVGRLLFSKFFSLIVAAKMFHYRTKHFSTHKTIDDFFEKFIDLSDKFLESWQGKHDTRIKFNGEFVSLKVPVITDENWKSVMNENMEFLKSTLSQYEKSSELLNIRDEMVALIEQTKYLLSFV